MRRFPCLWLVSLLSTPFLLTAAATPETHMVPMRDGVRLATDVYVPAAEGPHPVILIRSPYNKAMAQGGLGQAGIERGYVMVAQDTRGRFASEGKNWPFDRERFDGQDTLTWVADQPWCNGKIGTWGGSALSIAQYQLAASGTKFLSAQHFTVGAPNLYEVVYAGGIFRKALIERWLTGTKFDEDALERWTSHPTYDDYWKERDASLRHAQAHAAGIHIGGYWDIFAQATIDGFNGMQKQGGEGARGRQKLLMGPWTHGVLQAKAGELEFPQAKTPPGSAHDSWTWFDHYLQGKANGVAEAPAVTYYVLGDVSDPQAPGNTWRTADAWPPFPMAPTSYYLHAAGTVSTQPPGRDAAHLSYAYDPARPVPTVGGVELAIPSGPRDQKEVESREDVLVFSSEPLVEPLEVTGRVRARLWVSSDAPDTDFFVRLCDVYPDGRSFNICDGRVRARFRDGMDREVLLKPGEVRVLDVDLWSTSIVFNRGHRLRVHVTSSSDPGFDPNPNTGKPFRAGDDARVARNSLHLDEAHPSQLLLPVVAREPPSQ